MKKSYTFYTPNKPLIGILKPKQRLAFEKPLPAETPKSESIAVPERGDIRNDSHWDFGGHKQKEKCQRRGPINRNY